MFSIKTGTMKNVRAFTEKALFDNKHVLFLPVSSSLKLYYVCSFCMS